MSGDSIKELENRLAALCTSLAAECRTAATLVLQDAAPRSFIWVVVEDDVLFAPAGASRALQLRCDTETSLTFPAEIDGEEVRALFRTKEILDECATKVPFIFLVVSEKYDFTSSLAVSVPRSEIERSCCAAHCPNVDSSRERMQCSRCHCVFYCSRECQLRDWPLHKARCFGGGDAK